MAQQKVRISIPTDLGPDERIELSEAVIDFIRNRTEAGTGYRKETGRNYSLSSKPYTQQYAERKGVSRSSVDLSLSSQLSSLITDQVRSRLDTEMELARMQRLREISLDHTEDPPTRRKPGPS